MKYIDDKVNKETSFSQEDIRALTKININGIETIPYCDLKRKNCFEIYKYECLNFRQYIKNE